MKEFKITGYVTIGFEKFVECESFEAAEQLANKIELMEEVSDSDMNDWFDSVEVEEVEEINKE